MHARMKTGDNYSGKELVNSRGGKLIIPKKYELEFKENQLLRTQEQVPWTHDEGQSSSSIV